jgi:hypothetical protein
VKEIIIKNSSFPHNNTGLLTPVEKEHLQEGKKRILYIKAGVPQG